jgi:hypothetical protein
MSTVRLSDAVIPVIYESYTAINSPERTAFWQSGVITVNPLLSALAKQGSSVGTVPFWNDLDATAEPQYSNDDPADFSTPGNVGSGTMIYRKAYVNKSYAAMDLVNELSGSNPMQRIRDRFGTYWQRALQRRLIAMLQGVIAENVANGASDMIVDISANVGAAAFLDANAGIDAQFTMGDAAGNFTTIAMHSAVAGRLEKLDLVDNIPDSQGGNLKQYRGLTMIIDDNMPVAAGVYTSAFFGGGAIGFGGSEGHAFGLGEGSPTVPSEVIRVPSAGHGGGMETIFERNTWLLHPFGYKWVEAGAALAEFSPTLADLRLAAHWLRVVTRKQVPMAFVKSKVV